MIFVKILVLQVLVIMGSSAARQNPINFASFVQRFREGWSSNKDSPPTLEAPAEDIQDYIYIDPLSKQLPPVPTDEQPRGDRSLLSLPVAQEPRANTSQSVHAEYRRTMKNLASFTNVFDYMVSLHECDAAMMAEDYEYFYLMFNDQRALKNRPMAILCFISKLEDEINSTIRSDEPIFKAFWKLNETVAGSRTTALVVKDMWKLRAHCQMYKLYTVIAPLSLKKNPEMFNRLLNLCASTMSIFRRTFQSEAQINGTQKVLEFFNVNLKILTAANTPLAPLSLHLVDISFVYGVMRQRKYLRVTNKEVSAHFFTINRRAFLMFSSDSENWPIEKELIKIEHSIAVLTGLDFNTLGAIISREERTMLADELCIEFTMLFHKLSLNKALSHEDFEFEKSQITRRLNLFIKNYSFGYCSADVKELLFEQYKMLVDKNWRIVKLKTTFLLRNFDGYDV